MISNLSSNTTWTPQSMVEEVKSMYIKMLGQLALKTRYCNIMGLTSVPWTVSMNIELMYKEYECTVFR